MLLRNKILESALGAQFLSVSDLRQGLQVEGFPPFVQELSQHY